MQLKDKTAIVTGASTGIGRATAVEFAKEGAFTILAARSKETLLFSGKQSHRPSFCCEERESYVSWFPVVIQKTTLFLLVLFLFIVYLFLTIG